MNVPGAGQTGGRVVSRNGLEQLRESMAAQTPAPVAPALTSAGDMEELAAGVEGVGKGRLPAEGPPSASGW